MTVTALQKFFRSLALGRVSLVKERDQDVRVDDDVHASDPSHRFSRFFKVFHDIARAGLDESLPLPQRRTFGRDGRCSALHFPGQRVAVLQMQRLAYFLRHRRLAVPVHSRCRHPSPRSRCLTFLESQGQKTVSSHEADRFHLNSAQIRKDLACFGEFGTRGVGYDERLGEIVRRNHVEIGIIAVPAEGAQEVYDALADAGLHAVLNFAPVKLKLRDDVKVKSVDLRINLESLSFHLKNVEDGVIE